jgi:hypothetical protein
MLSIIHYISASRRLEESKKTVYMLGGDREAPEMIRAQRDMIALEKEYYEERAINWIFAIAFITFVSIIVYTLYYIKG